MKTNQLISTFLIIFLAACGNSLASKTTSKTDAFGTTKSTWTNADCTIGYGKAEWRATAHEVNYGLNPNEKYVEYIQEAKQYEVLSADENSEILRSDTSTNTSTDLGVVDYRNWMNTDSKTKPTNCNTPLIPMVIHVVSGFKIEGTATSTFTQTHTNYLFNEIHSSLPNGND